MNTYLFIEKYFTNRISENIQTRILCILIVILILATGVSTTASADNPGWYPLPDSGDTYLHEGIPDSNHGEYPYLYIGEDDEFRYHQETLLRFDHHVLPPDAQITNAFLKIYVSHVSRVQGEGPIPLEIGTANHAWEESGPNGISWTDAGTLAVSSFLQANIPASEGWHQIDITSLLQDWVSGDLENHGVVLSIVDSNEPNTQITLYSKESVRCAPYIDANYTTTQVPPPPPSIGVCGPRTDTVEPQIIITATPNPGVGGEPVEITAQVTDDDSGVFRVDLIRGSQLEISETQSTRSAPLSVTERFTLEPGIDRFSVLAWDHQMNGASASLQLQTFKDGVPPTIHVETTPSDPRIGDTVTFHIRATDESRINHITISANTHIHDFRIDPALSTVTRTFVFDEETLGYDPTGIRVVRYRVSATDLEGFYASTGMKYVVIGNDGTDTDGDHLSDEIEDILGLDTRHNDTDGDGLYDHWEVLGVDRDGTLLDLPAMGANPHHKDLFLEMDWWEDNSHSHKLQPMAVQAVINAYRDYTINFHVDSGQLGGGNTIPHGQFVDGSTNTNWESFEETQSAHFNENRLGIFYYMPIWQYKTDFGPKTHSRHPGDIMMGLGDPGGGVGSSETAARQATFFFHELGHTMGLGHGGQKRATSPKTLKTLGPEGDLIDEEVDWEMIEENCRPNYISNMNYNYQWYNHMRTDAGADVYLYSYSQVESTLDENRLNETEGFTLVAELGPRVWRRGENTQTEYPLLHTWLSGHYWMHWHEAGRACGTPKNIIWYLADGSTPIDWNSNGSTETTPYRYDLNDEPKWNGDQTVCNDEGARALLDSKSEIFNLRTKIYGSEATDFNLGSVLNHINDDSIHNMASSPEGPEEPVPPLATDGEYCDGEDNDGDGMIDEGFPDNDNDRIADMIDNCPFTFNPDQIDHNRNYRGDACENLPAAPVGLNLNTSSGKVRLQWRPNTEKNIIGYNIYVKRPDQGDFTRLGPAYPTTFKENAYESDTCVDETVYTISAINYYMVEGSMSAGVLLTDTNGDGICDQIGSRFSDPYAPTPQAESVFDNWWIVLLIVLLIIICLLFFLRFLRLHA